MRSVSVVLPESMWAEMPMLRMRSRGMRVATGLFRSFEGGSGRRSSQTAAKREAARGRAVARTDGKAPPHRREPEFSQEFPGYPDPHAPSLPRLARLRADPAPRGPAARRLWRRPARTERPQAQTGA